MQNKHEIWELRQMQALPLESKVTMTKHRIRTWVDEFGIDGVYVSFSGGKDSTVLVDIVRNMCEYQGIPLVFIDTGLEYPEIREFVRGYDNVEWLKPKMNFRQVIEKYGYPFISKEVSEKTYYAGRYLESTWGGKCPSDDELEWIFRADGPAPMKAKCLFGTVIHKKNGVETNERSKMFDYSRYKFLIRSPFPISNKCCDVMKKKPMHEYGRQTGRVPMTAQMAAESRLRMNKWLQHGCNAFDAKNPISNPMSFWTEQDVLWYIKENNLPICSVYGDIVVDYERMGQCENQMSFHDYGIFGEDRPLLKTTGCNRTGCMFCGIGCHLEKSPNRFERMKETHPNQYDYIMKPVSEGGLGYREIIDWINEHGNMNIRY